MNSFKIFITIFLLTCLIRTQAQQTIIHCGSLIDVKAGKLLTQKSIIVEKNQIVNVVDGYATAKKEDKIIDLKNKTVLPGLIDVHVHLEFPGHMEDLLPMIVKNPAEIAYMAQKNAQTTLLAGFTSVRDLGSLGDNVSLALRDAINKGLVQGPRMVAAGLILGTIGGHGDMSDGIRKDIHLPEGFRDKLVSGVESARAAVRQRYKDGSDFVKVTASAGMTTAEKSPNAPQFSQEELNVVVATAKDYGMPVASHSYSKESTVRSIKAGVSTLEHGYMDDEVLQLMKQYNVTAVPTPLIGKIYYDTRDQFPADIREKIIKESPNFANSFKGAYKGGIKIAFGTDAGTTLDHGTNATQFPYMVELGMPMEECLKTATINAAEVMGMQDKIGTIEKGKFADIIAVDGNPFTDPKVMMKVSFVMKDGVVYKQ